jgi:nicotinate dehydrogenase subunit B
MPTRSAIVRRDLLKGAGVLLVAFSIPYAARAAEGPWPKTIPPERIDSWLAVTADGGVTCFTGRVDLGTGIRTALAQIVADELDVDFERVTMVMGDTARTPDQGTTSASYTIQREAIPIRHAAAEARQILLKLASDRLGVPPTDLRVAGGLITSGRAGRSISYGELIGEKRFETR